MQRGARVVCPAMIIRSDRGGELFPAQGETNSSVRDCSPLRFPIFDPNLSSRSSLCLPPTAPNGPFSALVCQSVNQRNLAPPPLQKSDIKTCDLSIVSPLLEEMEPAREMHYFRVDSFEECEGRRKISRIKFNSTIDSSREMETR